MIRLDSYRASLITSTLFILAALVSAYMLYSLPGHLMLPTGYQTEMTGTYIAVALTFVLGALSVYLAFSSKKELIVYKEKTAEELRNEAEAESQREQISLESVKAGIDQGNSDKEMFQGFLQAVCKQLNAGQGAVYVTKEEDGLKKVALAGGYALNVGESATIEFEFGEGLIGQAASEGRSLYVDDIPEGYIRIVSGLGSASPRYLLIVPVKNQDQVLGVIEIACFAAIRDEQRKFVDQATQLLASKILPK